MRHGHACTLEKSPFGLNQVRQASTKALDCLLESLGEENIQMVLEPRLWTLFHHFSLVGSDRLKELHVVEIHRLGIHPGANHDPESPVFVFIIRPTIVHTRLVVQHIQTVLKKRKSLRTKCFIFHAGPWNSLCAQVLVQERIADLTELTLEALELGFMPLDDNILTMGMESILRDCYIGGNKTGLKYICESLQYIMLTVMVVIMLVTWRRHCICFSNRWVTFHISFTRANYRKRSGKH